MKPEQIERAVQLLSASHNVVAITGAGISTPSGIPDFRSQGGLWHTHSAEIASLAAVRRHPERFARWFQPLLQKILAALPNPAHFALAELEQLGLLRAVITQNIDGLHQQAGSRELYELHGNLRHATCLGCERQIPGQPVLARLLRGQVLRCDCHGVFKPDVVLFDEGLPRGLFWLAQRALDHADLLLVAGTSLEVAPVCDMPLQALRRGAHMIIVNKTATLLDQYADVVLRADVADALPALVKGVRAARVQPAV